MWKTIKRIWSWVAGPLDPSDEKFGHRTRFKLALLCLAVLVTAFSIAFYTAVRAQDDIERTSEFLRFAEHLTYVLAAVVGSYFGFASIWPSQHIYGSMWGGTNTTQGPYRKKAEEGNAPPVADDSDLETL